MSVHSFSIPVGFVMMFLLGDWAPVELFHILFLCFAGQPVIQAQ
jgi:hypothetical protein